MHVNQKMVAKFSFTGILAAIALAAAAEYIPSGRRFEKLIVNYKQHVRDGFRQIGGLTPTCFDVVPDAGEPEGMMVNYPTRDPTKYVELTNVITSDWNQITSCLWVKTTDPMKFTLIGYATTGGGNFGNQYNLACSGNSLHYYIQDQKSQPSNNFCTTLRDGEWHLVCASYDSTSGTGEWTIYVDDAVQTGFFSSNPGPILGNGEFLIGQDHDNPGPGNINAAYSFSGMFTGIILDDTILDSDTVATLRTSCIPQGSYEFTWGVDDSNLNLVNLQLEESTCVASEAETETVCALTQAEFSALLDFVFLNAKQTSHLIYLLSRKVKRNYNDIGYLYESRRRY